MESDGCPETCQKSTSGVFLVYDKVQEMKGKYYDE